MGMRLHFVTVPLHAPQGAQDELNRLLATQRVSHVDRHFVADGANSCWAVCVTLADGEPDVQPRAGKGKGVDYRELLAADEFTLYDRLRRLRKDLAEAEGLPPYAVFTNEQLAAMVRGRMTTAQALHTIEGVGDARVQRYGPRVLPLLQAEVPQLTDGPGPSPATGG